MQISWDSTGALGHNISQRPISVDTSFHHQIDLIETNPRVRIVLQDLKLRRRKIAVYLNDVIELASHNAVVFPLPVGDQGNDATELPTGFLFDFPRESFFDGLVHFNVTAHNVPSAREDSSCGRAALNEYAALIVPDDRADARWFAGRHDQDILMR